MAEVLTLGQKRLARVGGERVGEAVTEVELCRMAAALPEITVGGAGDLSLTGGYGLDGEPRLADELIEPRPVTGSPGSLTTMAVSSQFAAEMRRA